MVSFFSLIYIPSPPLPSIHNVQSSIKVVSSHDPIPPLPYASILISLYEYVFPVQLFPILGVKETWLMTRDLLGTSL